jgi:hypothetical protein
MEFYQGCGGDPAPYKFELMDADPNPGLKIALKF